MNNNFRQKQTKSILEYKSGEIIYGLKIKNIYFANKDREFIILKAEEDKNIHVFGGNLSEIDDLLSECKYLTESLKTTEKENEMFDYQRAIAINTFLLGEKQKSKKILMDLREKLQQRKILFKKLWYIGIFLLVTVIMIFCSLFIKGWVYTKFIRVATFGAIGGFISLNIRLKEVQFEISDSTISYIFVSIYKVIFSMLASIIVFFLIESDFILGFIKAESSNQLYFIYVISTLAGFSESLLPNIFKSIEEKAVE